MFLQFKNTSFICSPNLIVCELSTTNLHHTYPYFTNHEADFYQSCFEKFQFNDYQFIYLDIIYNALHLNIKLTDKDTYESAYHRFIDAFFNDEKKRNAIKKRVISGFFTINELKYIMYYK